MPFQPKNICLRGHNIEMVGRYPGGQCRECERQRVRQWKQDNRAQVTAYARAYSKAYRAVGPRRACEGYDDIYQLLLGR